MALTRRHLLTSALAAAGTLGLAVSSGCSHGTGASSLDTGPASQAADALVIGLTYTPNIQFAPFYMALEAGSYASRVSLRHHGEQEGQFDALLAGTEHLVVAGADEAAVAASNGADLVIVGGYYQGYPACVIVPEGSATQSLADLRGRTVGVPGRTGETWYALQLALDSADLSETDVRVQEIGYTQQAALVSGKVDAIVGFSNNDAVQIAQNGVPVRTIPVAEDVPLIGASLVTTRALLGSRREALAKAVTASASGMELFVADPDGAVDSTRQYVPDLTDPTQAARAREVAVATAALVRPEATSVVGSLEASRVEAMLTFLGSHSLLGDVALTAGVLADPLLAA